MIILVEDPQVDKFGDALMRKVRINCPCAKAKQCCALMDVTRLAALNYERDSSTPLRADQVLLNCGDRKE